MMNRNTLDMLYVRHAASGLIVPRSCVMAPQIVPAPAQVAEQLPRQQRRYLERLQEKQQRRHGK